MEIHTEFFKGTVCKLFKIVWCRCPARCGGTSMIQPFHLHNRAPRFFALTVLVQNCITVPLEPFWCVPVPPYRCPLRGTTMQVHRKSGQNTVGYVTYRCGHRYVPKFWSGNGCARLLPWGTTMQVNPRSRDEMDKQPLADRHDSAHSSQSTRAG